MASLRAGRRNPAFLSLFLGGRALRDKAVRRRGRSRYDGA